MSKITVTTLAGHTSGGDANKVKIESGDTLEVVSNATVGGTLGVTGDATFDTSVLKVDASNNRVGVGTASPSKTLHVSLPSGSGATATTGSVAIIDGNDNTELSILGGSSSVLGINFGHSGDNNDGIINYNTTNGSETMGFTVNATERMQIRQDGKMSIGGVAYAASAFSHVNFPAQGINLVNADTNGHFRAIYQSGDQNTYFTNGSVQAYLSSSGAWTNASDVSYKKDITDATYGIDAVKDMKPRFYYMKDESIEDTTRNIGFIAQELETVVPEVVSGDDGSKGVNYGHLTAVLTKALQEAIAEIETLKTKVDALESE